MLLYIIKQYIWLILVVFTALLVFILGFAAAVVVGNIFLDVVILTLLVFTFSYFYNKKKWQWYEFLNMFAYILALYSILFQILYMYVGFNGFFPVTQSLLYLSF